MQHFVVDDLNQVRNTIKNIIFDFGGVIFNIDYHRPIEAFRQLGFSNFELFYDKSGQTNLFDQLEIGAISPETFAEEIQKTNPKLQVDNAAIIDAWNSILIDIPKERITMIQGLQARYKTFLLSNTNAIHVAQFHTIVDRTMTLDYYRASFSEIYYSNEVGMRKPNAEIFELVIRENGLIPKETLFIDDSIQHVEGAAKAGIYSYHLDVNSEDILQLFADW